MAGFFLRNVNKKPIDQNQNTFGLPQRTSILDSAKTFQKSGLIPKFKEVGGINTLGDDYFENIAGQAEKRLRKQYFDDPNSILAQRENTIKRRGLFGSGIGEQASTDVFKGFGEELAGVQSDIARQRSENQFDVSKFNTDVAFRNAQNRNDLSSLLLGAAGDESRSATDFDTKTFDSLVNLRKGEQENQSRILESIRGTLGEKLIDPETRQFFESLFGSAVGDILGMGYNDFLRAGRQTQNNKNVRAPIQIGAQPNRTRTLGLF